MTLPDYVRRVPAGCYHSLSPTTKLVLALVEIMLAFIVRGWVGPLAMVAAALATAGIARVEHRTLRVLLLTSPLVVSIVLVNTFLFPDARDVLFRLGPLAATGTGLEAALQAVLRVAALVASVTVFTLTTPTDDLLADLEARGLGRRPVFVIGAAFRTVPRLSERAAEVTESQRARGMDTEGGMSRRLRGVVPLAGPMILGALAEVEEQTMALEARGFSASGRRTAIRSLPDSGAQRAVRWLVLAGGIAITVGSVAGFVRLP